MGDAEVGEPKLMERCSVRESSDAQQGGGRDFVGLFQMAIEKRFPELSLFYNSGISSS